MNQSSPPFDVIRSRVATTFDDEGLTRLCYDHYQEVYHRFKAGMNFRQKTHTLVTYCAQTGLLPDLLHRINFVSSSPLVRTFPPNPFGLTGKIADPDQFFDREDLLRQIFEELGKGVNLSLVGESQIGKSSLLEMICHLGPAQLNLPADAFAYLSLQWVEDEDDFYEALCEALGIKVVRGYKLVRALRRKRLILCLDEIEKMAWDGFTLNLRSHLRGLADGAEAPLKLVVASRSPLSRLFPDSPDLDSPLAGICRQFDVGPFPPKAARQFLSHYLQGTGITFTEAQITNLINQTHGHPARLHRTAADLYHDLIHFKTRNQ